MANRTFKIIVKTLTPFNISTGNKNNGFIKNLSVRNSSGKPYIPGSTMKGLIKDNYRLFNDDVDFVFGKEGYSPSKVIVENFELSKEDNSIRGVRFGNSIDRYRKVAKEGNLYSKETISGTFIGCIHVIDCDDELQEKLEAAIKMIKSIGGSKSTGFGEVKITIDSDVQDKADGCTIEKIKLISNNTILNTILKFTSPLVLGGKRSNSNFMASDDVIKGSVLRAAFAKVILDNCPVKDVVANESLKDKKNWVYYRKQESCNSCKFRNTCEKFSDIKFSYFYPLGTEIIPLTARVCKENKDHGFYDVLVGKDKCEKCDNEKLDFTTGLRIKGVKDKDKETYDVTKTVLTKNGINPYTKTSEDGLLYSVEAISASHILKGENQEETALIYEGSIEGMSPEELINFKTLRVGGDTTVGFGKCNVSFVDNIKDTIDYKKALKTFNEKYKENLNDKTDNTNYIAIKFNGDCKLDFKFDGAYKRTSALKDMWNTALWKDVQFKDENKLKDINVCVDKVYTEFINYRGYDNSLEASSNREKPFRMASKGTVIVFSSDCSEDVLYNYFENIKGFGTEQENGFGDFEIYFGGVEYGDK